MWRMREPDRVKDLRMTGLRGRDLNRVRDHRMTDLRAADPRGRDLPVTVVARVTETDPRMTDIRVADPITAMVAIMEITETDRMALTDRVVQILKAVRVIAAVLVIMQVLAAVSTVAAAITEAMEGRELTEDLQRRLRRSPLRKSVMTIREGSDVRRTTSVPRRI